MKKEEVREGYFDNHEKENEEGKCGTEKQKGLGGSEVSDQNVGISLSVKYLTWHTIIRGCKIIFLHTDRIKFLLFKLKFF